MVGMMCLVDFYFVKKNDMRIHHILTLGMIHYMNNHSDNQDIMKLNNVLLSTEISTIFLILNNLLDNSLVTTKKINKLAFVSTFFYYRIYNLSCTIFDKNIHSLFFIYSVNKLSYYEIYILLNGMFILNLYWFYLILKTVLYKNITSKLE
jgi:hypothetical protein